MAPDPRDRARLLDMLQAARDAVRFIAKTSWEDYAKNDLLRSAVERKVEIVGEAARFVSSEFADAHPEVEWRRIRSTRHILAHDYGRIDDSILWRIATIHLPQLITQLEPLVSEA
jgi:uncharacterized protein with HEPN domain